MEITGNLGDVESIDETFVDPTNILAKSTIRTAGKKVKGAR